jgi:hypothetical protein
MPWAVGIRFAHASLQVLADDNGIDLLHIKGPAVDESLLDVEVTDPSDVLDPVRAVVPRLSIDADVLVRPSHVDTLFDVMHRHGWTMKYRFEDGSAFEHAATMEHPFLAPVDVHRRFPGVGLEPEPAFQAMWDERQSTLLGGYPCTVPSVTAQRLILLLHAARGAVAGHPDIRRCWEDASVDQRDEVDALAARLQAAVGLAAGTGRLEAHRASPDYELWRALSTGQGSVIRMWAARVRAAPTRRDAVRTGVRLLVPNTHRLEASLGRPPTRGEVAAAYVHRLRWGVREVGRAVRASGRGGSS